MIDLFDIKEFLNSNKLRPKKALGQNFLVDKNVLKKIVSVANIEKKNVIEVGSGLGALTYFLASKSNKLISYEIDSDYLIHLEESFRSYKNVEIKNENFLTSKIDQIDDRKWHLVSNIPYYLTAKIIFKLFENVDKIGTATILVQKEVAERIVAQTSSKNYGKLSVTSQHFAEITKEFVVSKNSFYPKPKVDSAIVKFKFNKAKYSDEKRFINFVKISFQNQRKTLFNNLKTTYDIEKIKDGLEKVNHNLTIRPQQLTLRDFKTIFNTIN